MPSIQSPLGALPSRFRRQRILIIGCGDVGLRLARLLTGRVRVLALTSNTERIELLRHAFIVPLLGNLDAPTTLWRLSGVAHRVIHLAPPAATSCRDFRTRALLSALSGRSRLQAFVYGSTSGVYGDCAGASVAETRTINAGTDRAQRRVDAEGQIKQWGRMTATAASILRIPGIYAPDREGGTPRVRLLKGLPVLETMQDAYTNHIHADDLARACLLALWRGKHQRTYNISDDTDLKMGDYFDMAAGLYGLPKPPRVTRMEAATLLSPMQLSFMGESRRLVNTRMKHELGLKLRYPSARYGLDPERSSLN